LKYSKSNLEKLELLFKELEYTVRYEKGNFNSGYCLVEHKKIVVVNRFYDIEGRINILLDILSTLTIDETSLTEKSQQFFRQVAKNQENQLKELLQV
jgi:predicted RecB family nuclease